MSSILNRNVDCFIGCESEYRDADIVIFGAPFDSTTSYRPGARFASKAIRSESFGIETYSPYQDGDISDLKVFDAGDLELSFGDPRPALQEIEEFTAEILNDGKLPIMIGGEHLVTLGAVKAAAKRWDELHIIHFDAHADLRNDYLGAELSHASVMRRVWELVGNDRIYQFGIRSGDKSEFLWAKDHVIMNKFNFNGLDDVINLLDDKPVYLTIDLDVLDPSGFPGTGTPEAGGVSFHALLDAIIKTGRLNVVGCDLNELCPVYDQSGISTAMACKTLRELIISRKREGIEY
ncbi:MAG: agmatinase [Oscillospiraceae bacterium]|nr:agmatinase [Oscillospiraceae bacterium]MDD4546158.1 agmatinase [Oscillospiraceae bacterium]